MRFLVWFLPAFKAFAYVLLAGGAGFVLGDEISQRVQRAKMRNACYEVQAQQAMEMDEMTELAIQYRCRVNIP